MATSKKKSAKKSGKPAAATSAAEQAAIFEAYQTIAVSLRELERENRLLEAHLEKRREELRSRKSNPSVGENRERISRIEQSVAAADVELQRQRTLLEKRRQLQAENEELLGRLQERLQRLGERLQWAGGESGPAPTPAPPPAIDLAGARVELGSMLTELQNMRKKREQLEREFGADK